MRQHFLPQYRAIFLSLMALVVVCSVGIAVWQVLTYLGWSSTVSFLTPVSSVGQSSVVTPSPVAESTPYHVETFVEHLSVPWSMVFTSQTRILVTERPGKIRLILNEQLQPDPMLSFPEVISKGEDGLMGMVLHPQYTLNKWIYVCLAYPKNGGLVDKVVRLKDQDSSLEVDQIILDDIPAAQFHAGCRLAFGPDKKLYITTGDATQKQLAQDKNSLAGKILRINDDGSIPNDNPFANSPIFSYGHRNPQGLDWSPVTGKLYSTEHGPSVIDGPAGGDEINHIVAGQNYGWPLVSHDKNKPGLTAPLITYTPAEAPSGALFYTGTVFPQFQNNFLFGTLTGEGIIRLLFDPNNPDVIVAQEKLYAGVYGRIRTIVQGPDGLLYFMTSNQDGRGKPKPGDDTIYRLVPNI